MASNPWPDLIQSPAPDAEKPRRAIGWGRVSTEDQQARGESIPEQFRQIRSYADQNNIEIVDEYSETGSAFQTKSKRIQFHAMLERAKTDPQIDTIMVHDMSRFSRDSIQAQIWVRDLRAAGVEVVSVMDPNVDPTSSVAPYVEGFIWAKNEAYSRDIAMHTIKGCRANVQARSG